MKLSWALKTIGFRRIIFRKIPPVIAHRTSPTNIGLLQLATVSAHDLGYLGLLEFIERQELTFATLGKLGKFHGHFFNWYDTKTLQPLLPQYISTVDSGNLAGHLVALKQACIEMPDTKLFDDRILKGLADTINAISVEASRLGSVRQRTEVVTVSQLRNEIEACQKLVSMESRDNLPSWFLLFESLIRRVAEIEDIINALSHEHGEANFKELRWWVGALQHQVSSCRRDADTLVGWGRLLSQIQAEVWADPSPEGTIDESRDSKNQDVSKDQIVSESKEAGEHNETSWEPLLNLLHRVPALGRGAAGLRQRAGPTRCPARRRSGKFICRGPEIDQSTRAGVRVSRRFVVATQPSGAQVRRGHGRDGLEVSLRS